MENIKKRTWMSDPDLPTKYLYTNHLYFKYPVRKFVMERFLYITLCVILPGIVACTHSLPISTKGYKIESIRNANNNFILSPANILFIPLEFNSNCPIGNILKINITTDYIFVTEEEHIYQFDINGAFLRTIGSKGKGPTEYGNILDVTVDERENSIFVCDAVNLRILEYDIANGKHKTNYPYVQLHGFEVENSYFMINPMNLFGDLKYKLLMLNFRGDTIYSAANDILFDVQEIMLNPDGKTFQKLNDEIIFRQQFNDTVYTISSKGSPHLSVRYYFDFANAKFPVDLLGNPDRFDIESNRYAFIHDISETTDYIFVDILFKGEKEQYIINKKTDEYYNVKSGIAVKDTGIDIWPYWINNNDILITYFYATDLIHNEKIGKNLELNKIMAQLNEESNPVLMLVKLKVDAEKL
jgi:hypothetical protein